MHGSNVELNLFDVDNGYVATVLLVRLLKKNGDCSTMDFVDIPSASLGTVGDVFLLSGGPDALTIKANTTGGLGTALIEVWWFA